MLNKKSSLIVAAAVTIFAFITVAYISCSKPGKSRNVCENYVCQNGGYCNVDTPAYVPVCVCPVGFEGQYCETESVQKYYGNWNMTQTVWSSDSGGVGTVYRYTVAIRPTATLTTFFIDNLSNDPLYTDILCTIDSFPTTSFTIDTISAFHMLYDHYQILYGSGAIYNNNDSISGTFAARHLTPTSNWVYDTFKISMTLIN